MSFTGRQPRSIPRTPTLPQGETVAAYGTYLEAQKAVDHLADKAFPVQLVTIVGTDLRMVERVTGRLSYPRAALGGFVSGAWFGLFVGLLLSLFSSPGSPSPFIPAILIGGAFGLLFSVITYSFSRGRRDFTSSSQIVAASYAVLCRAEQAHKARELLREVGGVRTGWPQSVAPAQPPARPSDPTAVYPPPGPAVPPTGSPSVPPVVPPPDRPVPPTPAPGTPPDRPAPPAPGPATPPSTPPPGQATPPAS